MDPVTVSDRIVMRRAVGAKTELDAYRKWRRSRTAYVLAVQEAREKTPAHAGPEAAAQTPVPEPHPLVKALEEIRDTAVAECGGRCWTIQCKLCGGTRIKFHSVQDRSADEGMTTAYTCMNPECAANWRRR